MIIIPTYTSNVTNNAPAGFIACAQRVINFLQTRYINPVRLAITIDFAAISGAGSSTYSVALSDYASLRAAIIAKAQTANAVTAAASLPASDPTSGATLGAAKALFFALGLASDAGTATCTFNSGTSWTTDNSGGVPVGTTDLEGTMFHEFTEPMGRDRNGGVTSSYKPLDLFAYTAANTRSFNARGGYFSIDNGVTNLSTPNVFDTGSGDPGDWNGAAIDAGNATSTTGAVMPFSSYDITIMDILGWQLSNNPSNVAVSKGNPRNKF